MSADPWVPGDEALRASAGRELPPIADLLTQAWNEVRTDPWPWLLAGLPMAGVLLVTVFGAIVLVYGGMALGALPGAVQGDDGLIAVGMFTGASLGFLALCAGMFLVVTPLQAALWRAVWRHLTRSEPLSWRSSVTGLLQDLPSVMVVNLVLGTLVLGGALLCYLPGLVASVALTFAYPAVVIHRVPVGTAVARSVRHASEQVTWHLGLFGVLLLLGMVLPYLPIVGYALLATLSPLVVLTAYRAAFGDDGPRS